ncbi:Cell wall-associated hydrolase, NlpC family [Lachnospiraceae bacterium G11]|nr:Cell wall-associated hydrolase, NlpC family [Lachnospiraceae bacterium G11]
MARFRRLLGFVVGVAVLAGYSLSVNASSVAEIQKGMTDKQNKLNAENSNLSGLQSEAEALEQEIADLDSEILNLMTDIAVLEDQIEVKVGEIAEAQAEYDEAKATEIEQYEAMKIRIQYMYEMGETNYLSLLISAKSMSELLNKAEYVEQIYEYDRKKLEEFQEITKKVEELKIALENEKAELEDQKAALNDQKAMLDELIEQKKAQAADYAAQIAESRKRAQALKDQIAADQKKISQLQEEERKRLAAEAAKKAAASGNVGQTTATIITNATGSELGKQIATYACQFVGNPYVHGGTSLTQGADCSGFTYRVYADFGYSIPRSSSAQTTCGTAVDYANAQPGDIICMPGHVGIYIGNGQMVHASTPSGGIKIGTCTFKPVIGVRRIVN